MSPQMIEGFLQFGPLGLIILYLVWDKTHDAKERRALDHARAEADKALAASLAALTVTIQHFGQGFK